MTEKIKISYGICKKNMLFVEHFYDFIIAWRYQRHKIIP